MVSEVSEGISKDGIFWTYSYSSLAKVRWVTSKSCNSQTGGVCFNSVSSVSCLVTRGGWMLGQCLMSHLVPQGPVPVQQLPLQGRVTAPNTHGCHTLMMDRFLCCKNLSCFPHLAFLQRLKVTKTVEYWNKNPVRTWIHYVEGLYKCIPLLYFQMVCIKIWSELMATISEFQVCNKPKFKENYAVFLNYFQILKS